MKHSFSCLIYYFSVFWTPDETLLLVFDILVFGVWTPDETLLLVFDILVIGVWISDDMLLFRV